MADWWKDLEEADMRLRWLGTNCQRQLKVLRRGQCHDMAATWRESALGQALVQMKVEMSSRWWE